MVWCSLDKIAEVVQNTSMASKKKKEEIAIYPEVVASRQDKVGNYLIRELLKDRMEKKIAEGMSFEDAAESSGIPYEVALAKANSDPDFQRWLAQAPAISKKGIGRRRSPMEIKQDFVNKLAEAGLFDKATEIISQADPNTEEGKQSIGFFLKFIVKDLLPKESATKVETTRKDDAEALTDKELLAQLQDRREKRLALQDEVERLGGTDG